MRTNASRLLSMFVAAVLCTFAACNKTANNNTTTPTDYTAEYTVHTEDQARVSSEEDAVDNDINLTLETTPQINGRVEGFICDATATFTTSATDKIITIVYDGTNCQGNRKRTGTIVLSMPKSVKWKDAGAVLSVSFQNFKVTRIADDKSITINGIKTITNVSGGRLIDLASAGSITHRIKSDSLSITFDDGTKRTWHVDRQRVFSKENDKVVITITGLHTEGSITQIAEWGVNRRGIEFSTVIAEPLVIRQACDYRLVSGKLLHEKLARTVTVTFGLDAGGFPTTCAAATIAGHYYYSVQWRALDNSLRTLIFPY